VAVVHTPPGKYRAVNQDTQHVHSLGHWHDVGDQHAHMHGHAAAVVTGIIRSDNNMLYQPSWQLVVRTHLQVLLTKVLALTVQLASRKVATAAQSLRAETERSTGGKTSDRRQSAIQKPE
jgi:hypothetical protein